MKSFLVWFSWLQQVYPTKLPHNDKYQELSRFNERVC